MDDRGFTLIELLVVVLIIGILAAIALPTFLGQSDKARDASAKTDVRNAVSAMEVCYVNAGTYSGCPDVETPVVGGVVATVAANGRTYKVEQESASGTVFWIDHLGSTYERGCDAPGVGGCRAGSTW